MRQQTHRALALVSYLFLFVGAIALLELVGRIARGSFHFSFGNLGILGIGIFIGLRRYSRAWRTCALLFTWYGIVTLSIALIVCIYGQPPSGSLMLVGQRLSRIPGNWLAIPLVMVLLVTLWQYRVLTHPAVRRLFNEVPPPATVPQPNAG